MTNRYPKPLITATTLLLALLVAEPAAAFRCGTKLIKDGMHEVEVLAICGEPATRRDLGYALRNYDLRARRRLSPGWIEYRAHGHSFLSQEVVITEYVYNLGPRKLMRRLIFEAGLLVRVETLGRGYQK